MLRCGENRRAAKIDEGAAKINNRRAFIFLFLRRRVFRVAVSTRLFLRLVFFGDARQVLARVNRMVVDAHFVMKVRAGRAAGRADHADKLAAQDVLSHAHFNPRLMPVAGESPPPWSMMTRLP